MINHPDGGTTLLSEIAVTMFLFDQSSYFLLHLGCSCLTHKIQKKVRRLDKQKKVTAIPSKWVVPPSL